MTFGQSISRCFSKYCTFTGRASRSEYWWWILFTAIIGLLFGIPSGLQSIHESSPSGLPVISYIVSAVLFLPSLGVLFRRLHDTGKSGWWYHNTYRILLSAISDISQPIWECSGIAFFYTRVVLTKKIFVF